MSIPPPIQRESPQEVCLLFDLTILCLFTKHRGNIWPRTHSFLCAQSFAPFLACQFLHQYKERVHQEGLFLVWFDTIVFFSRKKCASFGQGLSLFCACWARLWLLFVNESFLLCFALAFWKCHNCTSVHICYLIFNSSTGCFCLFGWQWQWRRLLCSIQPSNPWWWPIHHLGGCCSQGSWNGIW